MLNHPNQDSFDGEPFEDGSQFSGFTQHPAPIPAPAWPPKADAGLETALKVIVEQAEKATHANGAAIALKSGELMVCRARAGTCAPELGAQLDVNSGLSGECLRTGQLLVCSDAETDPRVDIEVCRFLGIRSMVIVPIYVEAQLVGICEVFSPVVAAFGTAEITALQSLRDLSVSVLRPAPAPEEVQGGSAPNSDMDLESQESLGVDFELQNLFVNPDPEDDLICEHEDDLMCELDNAAVARALGDPHASSIKPRLPETAFDQFEPHPETDRSAISRKLILAGVAVVVLLTLLLGWCTSSHGNAEELGSGRALQLRSH